MIPLNVLKYNKDAMIDVFKLGEFLCDRPECVWIEPTSLGVGHLQVSTHSEDNFRDSDSETDCDSECLTSCQLAPQG